MSTQDTAAILNSLISEAENLADRIEKKTSNGPASAANANANATTKKQLERIYSTEWLARANFRTFAEARADIKAAISILRSLDAELGGGWLAKVGEFWGKVQSKLGWK